MSNELIYHQQSTTGSQLVAQSGNNNLHVDNKPGAVVNINYNISSGTKMSYTEQLMAVQRFSKDYYQLLVTCDDDYLKNECVTVSANRALTEKLVPDEIYERCSELTEDGINELMTFPAIICKENTDYNGVTDPNQLAVYAYINRIMKGRGVIQVAFKTISVFSQSKLCEKKNAIYFDLNMTCAITDLNRSAWSVHKVNLFKAFDEAGMPNMQRPF